MPVRPALQLFTILAFALSCFAPASAGAEDTGNIVIGQAIDLSSADAAIGRDYVAGIRTYFDALNAAGGINGRRVQFIVKDDQASPAIAAKAAAELIEKDRVDYLIGGSGTAVTQAVLNTPAFQRSGLALFAPLAELEVSNTRVVYWRPGYMQEMRHILSHFAPLGIKDIGIVYQNGASSREAFRSLSTELRGRGLRLTGSVSLGNDDRTNAQEAARLASTKPGFVIVIADTIQTALFLKEFRKHASQTFVGGTSLINLETLRELAGARAVEWTVFSQVVPNPNAGKTPIQIEHLNMMKKYRDEPPSSLTLEGFAVAKSLAGLIQQSRRPTRAALQEMLDKNTAIDLGGLSIKGGGKQPLSGYVDIALFKKNGLIF